MKKLCLFLCCFFISGCFGSSSQIVITPKDILTIQIPDKQYGKFLKDAWDQMYPQWKQYIQFVEKPYTFTQVFDTDIIWTNDIDVQYLYGLLTSIDNHTYAYDVSDTMMHQQNASVFVPIMGSGLILCYDEDTADMRKDAYFMKEDYHHSREMEYVFPFFVDCFVQDGIVSVDTLMDEEQMIYALKAYKEMYTAFGWSDDTYENDKVLDDVSYGLYDSSLLIGANMSIGVQKKPTYEGVQVPSYMQTYGFSIQKNCQDVAFANVFLSFVRSYEGIQALIKSKYGVALIQKKDIDDFKIYDAVYKDMVSIMSTYTLYPSVYLEENPSLSLYKIWKESDIIAYIQNYICGDIREEEVVSKIKAEILRMMYT